MAYPPDPLDIKPPQVTDCYTNDNCPFCGEDIPTRPSVALMLHEAHEAIERLVAADRDSEEFDDLLDEIGRFVGVK